jgi:hypothetical protein
LAAPGDEASTIPLGKVSVNATPVNATLALGFVIVSVKVVVPPSGTEVALKLLVIEGGDATVIDALAVLPAPALADVTFPVVLFMTPLVVAVTFTTTVHVPAAAIVPPLKFSV